MESLYRKLYNKYSKLKTEKFCQLEKLNQQQEEKFKSYTSVADDLIEHLRNENARLQALVNVLTIELTSNRFKQDEKQVEYQKLLMEENQKNEELSGEIQRLQNLQKEQQEFRLIQISDKNKNGEINTPDVSTRSDVSSVKTRKRRRGSETELERENGNSRPGAILEVDLPECCKRRIEIPGEDTNTTVSIRCMFQNIMECLIGMKLSMMTEKDGICVSAFHQSSGYSFSLELVKNSNGEGELIYRVLSLGTFERVAPEWMRTVIVFSTRMLPIFFERVSRIVKLQY